MAGNELSTKNGIHTTNITRAVDELGRIVLPKPLRDAFKILPGKMVEFFDVNGEFLALKQACGTCEIEQAITVLIDATRGMDFASKIKVGQLLKDLSELLGIGVCSGERENSENVDDGEDKEPESNKNEGKEVVDEC